MQLGGLVAAARSGNGAVYTFEQGKATSYSFRQLAADVDRIRATLSAWGVKPRMRVGLYAPNSYQWLVHDLALIEIGAISVRSPTILAGTVNQSLLDRYNIALLLLSTKQIKLFSPPKPAHVAFIDSENTILLL